MSLGGSTLQFVPLSFDVSFQEIFSTLCGGGTLRLVTESQRKDPAALVRLVADEGIERVFLPMRRVAGIRGGRASPPERGWSRCAP